MRFLRLSSLHDAEQVAESKTAEGWGGEAGANKPRMKGLALCLNHRIRNDSFLLEFFLSPSLIYNVNSFSNQAEAVSCCLSACM